MVGLGQSSLTDGERRSEAETHLEALSPFLDAMAPHERKFVEDMKTKSYCTPRQLFWLRDLNEKYT